MRVEYNCTNPDTPPSSPSQTVNYTYDAAGNRTQVQDSVNGTTSYTPNSNNQYTTAASSPATYDGRGNLASFGGTTYTYDANNLLLQATAGANVTTQAYDPLGRCVKQVANGTTTYFVYDTSWNTLADFNSGGTQTARYVHGPATDELLTKTDNTNTVVYYHTDGLGSITKLTSSTGAVLEQYSYDVYGKATIKNASGTVISATAYGNRFLFTGREYIASLNLYNYRARLYSAQWGRFLQPDPIGHNGDFYNIYRYCENDPIDNVDPSGTVNWTTVSTGGAEMLGAGAGVAAYLALGGLLSLAVLVPLQFPWLQRES